MRSAAFVTSAGSRSCEIEFSKPVKQGQCVVRRTPLLRVKTLLLFPLLALALAGCGGATPAGSAVSGGSSIPADPTPPSVPRGLTATAVSSPQGSLSSSAPPANPRRAPHLLPPHRPPRATTPPTPLS